MARFDPDFEGYAVLRGLAAIYCRDEGWLTWPLDEHLGYMDGVGSEQFDARVELEIHGFIQRLLGMGVPKGEIRRNRGALSNSMVDDFMDKKYGPLSYQTNQKLFNRAKRIGEEIMRNQRRS